jgi:CheY-like chemotaxis protein
MCRALVVDDDRDCADTFRELLVVMGHEAQAAYSGAEALEVATSFRPEVALVDLAMPGMTGIEVARRQRQGRPRPWLVAVTGLHPDHVGADVQAFDFRVVKPVEPSRLRELIEGLAGGPPRGG